MMGIDAWILAIIALYSLNLLTIIGLIFFERRGYNSFLVWLIVLITLPVIGVFAYLILGKGPTIGKKKKFLYKIHEDEKYYKHVEEQKKYFQADTNLDNASSQLAYYNLVDQSSILTENNEIDIITDNREMYKQLFNDIDSAKTYVNVLFFIVKGDKYGKEFRDLLTKKAKEGVKIRFIFDSVGSFRLRPFFFSELKKAGGEVYGFSPSVYRYFFRNVNFRNHRKIVVIDGEIAYTGGANIGKEYVDESKRITPWHDTTIRVQGDGVTLINLRFMQDYNFTAHKDEATDFKPQVSSGNKVMQIISSGPDSPDEKIKLAYIKAIYSARKRVYIQTPYYIPDESFQVALITAAKSGVDVRIMIPGVPDKKYAYLCTTYYMKELLPYGIKIYMWKGFMHSKTLIIDDEITSIGTFNIDIRSFKLHFEMTAFIYNKDTTKELTDKFLKETKDSKLIPVDYKGTIGRRILESIMRLFTPLM